MDALVDMMMSFAGEETFGKTGGMHEFLED